MEQNGDDDNPPPAGAAGVVYDRVVVDGRGEPAPEPGLVPVKPGSPSGPRGGNDAHGNPQAFTVSDEERFLRFLVLGTEGGTFYATERVLTAENARCVNNLIQTGQGRMVVEKIKEVVKNGRVIRMNAPLLSLVLCCRSNDQQTKMAAYRAVSEVCVIPTHLFKLVKLMEAQGESSGWGRGLRKAVSRWYNQFTSNPQRLAMLLTKYRQREGWSHRDLMRLSHLRPANAVVGFILRYGLKGLSEAEKQYLEDGQVDCLQVHPEMKNILAYLKAIDEVGSVEGPRGKKKEALKRKRKDDGAGLDSCSDMSAEDGPGPAGEEGPAKVEGKPAEPANEEEEAETEIEPEVLERVLSLIHQFDLVREHLPTHLLNVRAVWEALLEKMPMTALVRNLAKITNIGLFDQEDTVTKIVQKITNQEYIRKSKLHPYSLLVAWHTYKSGKGVKGHLRWEPHQRIVDALESAFYLAFGNVESSNKRVLIAVDVSGSMHWNLSGHTNVVTPAVGSAAMALVTKRAEQHVDMVAFSGTLTEVSMTSNMTLEELLQALSGLPFGGTDCALPVKWALANRKSYDAFIVYTDNETWSSVTRVTDLLQEYRREMNIPTAKMAVVGMVANQFTIADPADLHMMDFVGFDVETPHAMQEFISGSSAE